MLDKFPDILKAVGTYIAGVAFLAGVVFCFLGLFDIGDLKSITSIKSKTLSAWPPVIVGGFLITVGIALHLLPKPGHRAPEDSEQSAGSIYVLRHMDAIGGYRPSSYFGYQLYWFNTDTPAQATFAAERNGWDKASDYAVRALTLRGLAEREGTEYRISTAGAHYLDSPQTRAKYPNAFARPL